MTAKEYPIMPHTCKRCGNSFLCACRNAKWCPDCKQIVCKEQDRVRHNRRYRSHAEYHIYTCKMCGNKIKVFGAHSVNRTMCQKCMESSAISLIRYRASIRADFEEVIL